MRREETEEERIGEESEDDLEGLNKDNFSTAVLWATDWTTETIISQLKKGNIELSPTFQRREAWNDNRKSQFIESIILGLPIPQIILAERKEQRGSYIVIDGKQRLLSIRKFCSENPDEFKPLKLHGLKVLQGLNGKTYNDMLGQLDFSQYNTVFDNQSIRTVIIRNWPNQNFLYTVFLRLNTGSLPLSPQELRQALIPGAFTSFADDFSVRSEQIKKALKLEKPDYRMRDVEIVVRYFAFKNFIEQYKGNLKEFLDSACNKLNDQWEEDSTNILDQADELNNAIDATYQIFGINAFSKYSNGKFSGVFNRPVFDLMTYFFSVPEIRYAAVDKKEEICDLFIQLCQNDIAFIKSLETSTKNIETTTKRYSEWGKGLKAILQQEIRIPQRAETGIELV